MTKPDGLTGLYGHTLDPADPDREDGEQCLMRDGKIVGWQFQIIRRMDDSRWLVRLFSWHDGSATRVTVIAETDLLDETKTILYETQEDMHAAYTEASEKANRIANARIAREHAERRRNAH